jgi:copper transport protein
MKNPRLLLLLTILLFCAGTGVPVSAHAMLLRSNPPANAILDTSPAQVELFFSEPVAPSLSSLKILDSNGKQADQGDMRVDLTDPTRMTVSLPALEVGVYTVSWTAVSAADGHQTEGTFSFAVGSVKPAVLPASVQTSSASLPASELFSKWLLLSCLALLGGRMPFLRLVWNPAVKPDAADLPAGILQPPAWQRLTRIGLAGILAAILLGILSQAGQSNGDDLALPWAPVTLTLLSTTNLGLIWLVRLALALLSIWFAMGRPAAWKDWLGFGTALGLMLSVSLTAHAATEAQPAWPVIDDFIHILGMTVWLGGLAYLLTGLRTISGLEARLHTRLTSLSMGRFSGMALAAVGAIGLTGLYSATLRVGTLQALLTSIYGHALLFKQIFVIGLLILAGVNLVILSPRLKRSRLRGEANTSLAAGFGKVVLAESILGVLLLAAVSLLTYLPPARINPSAHALQASAKVNDLKVDLSITPGEVGQNTFLLRLSSNGLPMATVKQALLRFTPQAANIAPSEGELIGRGDGTYTAKGTYLSLPGKWQVQVVVRREDKFDAFANFDFALRNPGAAGQAAAATPHFAGVLFLLNGLIVLLLAATLPVRLRDRFALGILPFMLTLVLGLYYLTLPIQATASQINPINPDTKSIAAGEAVYATNCVRCHGVSGKGDGPDGLILNPRPADLTKHGLPGVHTDAQLYDWITNGLPGTRMPAWKDKMSDTDRWNLINYLRVLAQLSQ